MENVIYIVHAGMTTFRTRDINAAVAKTAKWIKEGFGIACYAVGGACGNGQGGKTVRVFASNPDMNNKEKMLAAFASAAAESLRSVVL